ncbi:MAG TPA: histidine kinase dimerization/phosphoacceptor domain -containing protein [Micropepsaceae bacterium]|nr:histidine kinase dimerization/phosphoacceptor domain -containing protein [Micropepsaceae bacterium]
MAPPPRLVEPKPGSAHIPPATGREVELRVRQQEFLAKLGVLALKGTPFASLAEQAVQLVAEGLDAEFCKILQYLPDEHAFVLRAGVGWNKNLIGVAKLGADLQSPAGYALRTGKPVISNHLAHEGRFQTPELLHLYGIQRAINVILQGEGSPYGVLEADSRSPQEFSENDIAFLQGAANILGMSMDRERVERDLRSALDQQKMLLKELNHRVKNSLQLVASMLELQSGSKGRMSELEEASKRVMAIARAHEHLYRGTDVTRIDIGQYLSDIGREIERSAAPCNIDVNVAAAARILVNPDRAISLALIVNELVTNAVKHAYPNKSGCTVWVRADVSDHTLTVSVRDGGIGLPEGFDLRAATKSLGMRIVKSLAQQIHADLAARRANPGAEFILRLPFFLDDAVSPGP